MLWAYRLIINVLNIYLHQCHTGMASDYIYSSIITNVVVTETAYMYMCMHIYTHTSVMLIDNETVLTLLHIIVHA